MKQILILLFAGLTLAGCDRSQDPLMQPRAIGYFRVCIYGQQYVHYDRGLANLLTPDGKPIPCESAK